MCDPMDCSLSSHVLIYLPIAAKTIFNIISWEAVDWALHKLTKMIDPFGWKVVLFADYVHKTLPVFSFEAYPLSRNSTPKSTYLWGMIKNLKLTSNMRLRGEGSALNQQEVHAFGQELLHLDKGNFKQANIA